MKPKTNLILFIIHCLAGIVCLGALMLVFGSMATLNSIAFLSSKSTPYIAGLVWFVLGIIAYATSYKAIIFKLFVPLIFGVSLVGVALSMERCTADCVFGLVVFAGGAFVITIVYAVVLVISTSIARYIEKRKSLTNTL